MREILHLPATPVEIDARIHRRRVAEGYAVESISYAAGPGSRITAVLYLPERTAPAVPAVVLACGHGGSKSGLYAQYAGQLYARMGFACLVPDTLGEEERDDDGRMGTRGHDRLIAAGRASEEDRQRLHEQVLGKIVWDLLRGVDYLCSRSEVNRQRIGMMGYSLGGATAGCAAILDERIRAAVICGWVFRARIGETSKLCTRLPYAEFTRIMGYEEMTALPAPHCATLFMLGDSDAIIDSDEQGAAAVRELREHVAGAHRILNQACIRTPIEIAIEPASDHRPFLLSRRAVAWLQERLVPVDQRRPIPDKTIRFGDWVDGQGGRIEPLYDTPDREQGLQAVDIGAVLVSPKDLACFPEVSKPSPEYTTAGWIKTVLDQRK